MGSDMYLEKRIYLGALYDFNEGASITYITARGDEGNINVSKIRYIAEEAAYWRTVNQSNRRLYGYIG